MIRSLYAGVIARGIEAGVFNAGDPEALAHTVLATVQGLACQSATDLEGKLPVRPEVAATVVLSMLGADRAATTAESTDAAPAPAP